MTEYYSIQSSQDVIEHFGIKGMRCYDDGHRYRFDRDRHNYKSHMYAELLKEKTTKAKRKGKTLKESTVNLLNKKIKKHDRLFKENAKIANMYK